MTSTQVTFTIVKGQAAVPCPVPAAQVISVVPVTTNTPTTGRYDAAAQFVSIGPSNTTAPNGELVFCAPVDGAYSATVWHT